MMQSPESRVRVNLASHRMTYRCSPTCGRIFRESEVRPIFMVVANILGHQPLEVLLIQDDHVVQQVASTTSNPALSNTVLPRTAKASAGWLASDVPYHRHHIGLRTLSLGRIARIGGVVRRPTLPAIVVQPRKHWDFASH